MARNDPQVNLRMPADLKERLDAAADANKRSLTAEVVDRLQASFEDDELSAPGRLREFVVNAMNKQNERFESILTHVDALERLIEILGGAIDNAAQGNTTELEEVIEVAKEAPVLMERKQLPTLRKTAPKRKK